MAQVFVITGPSGVGKGTLIAELLRRLPDLEVSISATTRQPRAGEVDGASYHFLSDEEFDRRLERGDFLEWAGYGGSRYGTLRSEVEDRLARGRSVVLEIEVQGARQVRDNMPEAHRIFIAPPNAETLRERLVGRGTDSEESIERRLREAETELKARPEFQHVIINDDLKRAADDLDATVRAVLGGGRYTRQPDDESTD